ncbi:MAG: polysaccharide deacetylase family protein, partial [Syntrophomonadaceae bacterium]|nr:polysaccharide deacetylase family protein [Syntrophomonadaceae bacterium]
VHRKSLSILIVGILILGVAFGAYKFAFHPNLSNWKKQKIVITDVDTDVKVVALSFDDGPDPINTPLILEALERHNAKATFFVLGIKSERYPFLIKKIIADGHEIGNHTYSHPDFHNQSEESMLKEIKKCSDIIYKLTGQFPSLFRPPGGFLSHDLVDLVKNEGLTIAYWTYQQDSRDWKGKSAAQISDHIEKHISPGQIIILHDGSPNGIETAKALDILIPKLKEEGYEFVTITELVNLGK